MAAAGPRRPGALLAQDPVAIDQPILGDFDLTKPIKVAPEIGHIHSATSTLPHPHCHMHTAPLDCTGQPDGLAGKFNGVYYARISGKDVCGETRMSTLERRRGHRRSAMLRGAHRSN